MNGWTEWLRLDEGEVEDDELMKRMILNEWECLVFLCDDSCGH